MFCVVKGTTISIDSSNTNSEEQMLQNAQNTGFAESEVEILTEEEYQARVELEPKPPQPPSDKERIADLEIAISYILGGAI